MGYWAGDSEMGRIMINVMALLGAMVVVAVAMPLYISWMRRAAYGQAIREDGPAHHQTKAGTPTGGGMVLITGAMACWGVGIWLGLWPVSSQAWGVVGVTLALAMLGAWDDTLKIAKKHNKGVHGYTKLGVQLVAGGLLGWLLLANGHPGDVVVFNWFRLALPDWLYISFAALVVTAASNAVNLTDGLDGLAASTMTLSLVTTTALLSGTGLAWLFSTLSHGSPSTLYSMPLYPELSPLAMAFTGAVIGFWFYNRYQARVFMGDAGSLSLGGALAAFGLVARLDFWLLLIGLIYVLETLSVILQVTSVKLRQGKRLFRMSPLHHHFELGGWHETRVVGVFTLLQLLACLVVLVLWQ